MGPTAAGTDIRLPLRGWMGTLMDSLQNAGGCSGQASTAAQQQVSAGSTARDKGGSACAVQGVALGIGEC